MRILLLAQSFNSLTQRIFVELEARGHEVSVELDIHDSVTIEAVALFKPDVVVAPFLKRAIPEAVWRNCLCLIVHPGICGDRGPSALDWAILDQQKTWGVTVLEAIAEMDAGPVWAWAEFQMRPATKSSLYRREVTEAATQALLDALRRYEGGLGPLPNDGPGAVARPGAWRPLCRQSDRAIDWKRDDTRTVLTRIASADGSPGIRDHILGRDVYLHDAHPATGLAGVPGALLATSGPAVARATVDGAVWIGHLRDPAGPYPFKLPATRVLGEMLVGLPEIAGDSDEGYREIVYEERAGVGYLFFSFLNGAMGTDACIRLAAAYEAALRRPTKVVVLAGGSDFWSNGMDLNAIEAAQSPADCSWRNINAIDDLAEAIIRTDSHLTVAALQGNAGAGGVFLARAADAVWLRESVVLSPHYKDMGNLYGSEFWTYLLPRHAGEERAAKIMSARLPMGAAEAVSLGLADARFGWGAADFLAIVRARAEALASAPDWMARLAAKNRSRAADEAAKPLQAYRSEELQRMHANFYGFDPSYHIARSNFVRRVPKSRTPVTIARHRDKRLAVRWRNAS
ncbi:sensor protein hoxX [Hyphomicrobium denitrificans 1NES1]|uniref:Sensor protein hoxX n=1 Tax=Hyphomicrobium denitrificans 1NES1 TaxID=670307 RepID=N0B9X6_9HYPH|nr:hydrogenase maturation protein [Hyphomicrobium denitrificans]AGK57351.1 sensor protein hoxX [Hyphomicrobium denitrificans 1NES1]